MRLAVASEELAQPQRVGRPAPADDRRPSGGVLDQGDPSQDERAHDELAQVGVGDDEPSQVGLLDHEDLRVLAHPSRGDHPPAGQLPHLAGEGPGPVGDDRLLARGGPPHDIDDAREDHEHRDMALPLLVEDRAGGIAPPMAVGLDQSQLVFAQAREDLLAAGLADRHRFHPPVRRRPRRRSTSASPHRARASGRSGAWSPRSAWWRDGSSRSRSSRRGRTTGRGAGGPRCRPS